MLEMISLQSIPVFLLIFARMTAFFVIIPFFAYRTIPMPIKIATSFCLALVFYSITDVSMFQIESHYLFLLMKEIMVGLLLGFSAYVIIATVQVAGGFVDFQMGFAIANIIDPQTGAQSPLTGQFFYMITLLFLLATNGHHLLIEGIYSSYQMIPVDRFIILGSENIAIYMIQTFSKMFLVAFQIAIPIVGCLFLVDIALGIIARTVPQLNVFVVGLPIKIFVSFVMILIFLPFFIILVRMLFETMFQTMSGLMRLFGGA